MAYPIVWYRCGVIFLRNYFLKRPFHTLSSLYDVPVGFEPPLFETIFALILAAKGWLFFDIG